jgi:hypothetical protein
MLTENMIVNHMLTIIGEGGVSTLNTLHPSVVTAKGILETEDLSFQARGWWFNKERDIKLVPNEAGQVEVPENALAVVVSFLDTKTPAEKLRYVKRGKYIYDTYLHTNNLHKSVHVTLTLRLSVSDLPLVASNYLKHRCAELIYIADDGDNFKSDKLTSFRMEAWQLLKAQELITLDVNALDNTVAQQLGRYNSGYPGVSLYGGGQR